MLNRQVVLVSRPSGIAQAENFAIREATVVSPAEGQILVRNEFVSVEPAMRGWIADRGNYSAPVAIGSVMRALAVSEVVESRHPDYRRRNRHGMVRLAGIRDNRRRRGHSQHGGPHGATASRR
jgi:NADPH-dependent curcumin reductase CurA